MGGRRYWTPFKPTLTSIVDTGWEGDDIGRPFKPTRIDSCVSIKPDSIKSDRDDIKAENCYAYICFTRIYLVEFPKTRRRTHF